MKKSIPASKAIGDAATGKTVSEPATRLTGKKVAGGAALAVAVLIAAINIVPRAVEAFGKAKTPAHEKDGIPTATNATHGNRNSVNSGTQSGVNAGRDFKGVFNSG